MENHQVNYSQSEKEALILSMCGLLMNKVKLVVANPLKNSQLAKNHHLTNLIELIAEHLLPQYIVKNYDNPAKLSLMHNLCFLLASKVQSVFTSSVIRTCIDQNWDLKGYRHVLIRILQEMGVEDVKKLQDFFDKLIQSQNLQSQSCVKAISQFLRNPKKNIEQDDLRNPMQSFQTDYEFVRNDIQSFRSQNMKNECFQVLHPWAYDLDLVDFKYIINKDQTQKVCNFLKDSQDAQILWLSFFKSQLSASCDEFFGTLKEICIMNNIEDFFEKNYDQYKKFMVQSDFVISLNQHAKQIVYFVSEVSKVVKHQNFSIFTEQIRIKALPREPTEYINESNLSEIYQISSQPDIEKLQQLTINMKIANYTTPTNKLNLKRDSFKIKPTSQQGQILSLKFQNADTEELKDLEIKFDGNLAQFKVGEGDCNHYVISNDKKLWESQFMIVNKNGKYYLRDLGVVHTSRLKVTNNFQLQIHQGALIDLGKVVHYHVDKLTHMKEPSQDSTSGFVVMRGSNPKYRIDDEAQLRARPTWVSADENKEMVQNEILLEASQKKNVFSVGRSNRRDVEIKLKAVSADHCKIQYEQERGWLIHENEKDKPSSNGTFVFMKSFQQMDDHEPSDLIPLFNGMTISFINYELQVRIQPKKDDELAKSEYEPLDLTSTANYEDIQLPNQKEVPHQMQQVEEQKQVEEVQQPYQEDLQETRKHQNDQQLFEEDKKEPVEAHEKELQKEPSQKSLKQSLEKEPSQASIKQSVHEQSQKELQESPSKKSIQEDHTNQEHETKEDKARVKEDVVEGTKSMTKLPTDEQKHEEEKLQPVVQQSPKMSERSKKKDEGEDEPHHELMKSYSKRNMGELIEEGRASQLSEKKHEEQQKQQESHEQNETPVKDDEIKSQKSIHQTPAKEEDEPKHDEEVKESVEQNQPHQDEKSENQNHVEEHQEQPKQEVEVNQEQSQEQHHSEKEDKYNKEVDTKQEEVEQQKDEPKEEVKEETKKDEQEEKQEHQEQSQTQHQDKHDNEKQPTDEQKVEEINGKAQQDEQHNENQNEQHKKVEEVKTEVHKTEDLNDKPEVNTQEQVHDKPQEQKEETLNQQVVEESKQEESHTNEDKLNEHHPEEVDHKKEDQQHQNLEVYAQDIEKVQESPTKEEHQDAPKEEPKEETKEEPKEESKAEHKEEHKEQHQENPKEEHHQEQAVHDNQQDTTNDGQKKEEEEVTNHNSQSQDWVDVKKEDEKKE